MKTSVLLLTHNEALNITRCLRSLQGAGKIAVIDSGSTDGTVDLIRQFDPSITVVQRPFRSFSDQRNYGLDHCFGAGEWVLHLDADERMTTALAQEIGALDADPPGVAYNIASMTYFRGRAIPRASGYPVFQTRLTRAGRFRFVEVGHGQKAPPEMGPIPRLRHHYEHHPLDKGMSDWIARHDRYSTEEAEEWRRDAARYTWRAALTDPIARRQWLKQASRRLPAAPTLIYLYLMVGRLAILEGCEGRDFCRMRMIYEHLISLKVHNAPRSISSSQIDRN